MRAITRARWKTRENAVLRSKSAVAYAVYGEALYRLEKSQGGSTFADANKELQKSLALDPSLGLTHAYYSEMLMDMDNANWQTASAEAKTAIALAPNSLESHRAMGYIFQLTANYNEALSRISKSHRYPRKTFEIVDSTGGLLSGDQRILKKRSTPI